MHAVFIDKFWVFGSTRCVNPAYWVNIGDVMRIWKYGNKNLPI